jgi:cobalamin biosynthesis protein CobD/CbiB
LLLRQRDGEDPGIIIGLCERRQTCLPSVQTERHITVLQNFWRKHTDKVGAVGSIFAALCCLGFPALLSIFVLALVALSCS